MRARCSSAGRCPTGRCSGSGTPPVTISWPTSCRYRRAGCGLRGRPQLRRARAAAPASLQALATPAQRRRRALFRKSRRGGEGTRFRTMRVFAARCQRARARNRLARRIAPFPIEAPALAVHPTPGNGHRTASTTCCAAGAPAQHRRFTTCAAMPPTLLAVTRPSFDAPCGRRPRLFHFVTPVSAHYPSLPSRDVLVLTFLNAKGAASASSAASPGSLLTVAKRRCSFGHEVVHASAATARKPSRRPSRAGARFARRAEQAPGHASPPRRRRWCR